VPEGSMAEAVMEDLCGSMPITIMSGFLSPTSVMVHPWRAP
jgi:hypothetical protein